WALRYGTWGMALVALAGPLSNLALATILAIWLQIVILGPEATRFLVTAVSVNIGFFVFNMIPFPPLDGSRVLYAVAPRGLRAVMDRIEQAGLVAVFLFLFIGYQFIAPVMATIVQAIMRVLIPG